MENIRAVIGALAITLAIPAGVFGAAYLATIQPMELSPIELQTLQVRPTAICAPAVGCVDGITVEYR
jgi:cytochrome bd-type quinol oxidase subunit 1